MSKNEFQPDRGHEWRQKWNQEYVNSRELNKYLHSWTDSLESGGEKPGKYAPLQTVALTVAGWTLKLAEIPFTEKAPYNAMIATWVNRLEIRKVDLQFRAMMKKTRPEYIAGKAPHSPLFEKFRKLAEEYGAAGITRPMRCIETNNQDPANPTP